MDMTLIDYLRSFDRKERFAVFKEVFGLPRNDDLCIGHSFRTKLEYCIATPIPEKVFCATDYHLDWIEASLHLLRHESGESFPRITRPSDDFNKSQRDIDLLIAFEDDVSPDETHVVLVEAKAYDYWNKQQLEKKIRRLQEIFERSTPGAEHTKPHLVLLTNKKSTGITADNWSCWMKKCGGPNWLCYCLPPRKQIRRCDFDGNQSKEGELIKFDCVPKRNADDRIGIHPQRVVPRAANRITA